MSTAKEEVRKMLDRIPDDASFELKLNTCDR
jgi:hypothetical protein